jgi:hypothetical protein
MTNTPPPQDEVASKMASASVSATPESEILAPSTIVIEKKRKKRRYSRGLRNPQRVSRRLTRASHKLVRAVSSGMSTYRDREDRSSRRKRDGAIKDALKNWARAMGKTMRKSSGVPYDIARAFDTKKNRKSIRAVVRATAAFSPFR